MTQKTLSQVVADHPYPDFGQWWPMGKEFLIFMSTAIGSQWQEISDVPTQLSTVQQDVTLYMELVYQRVARPTLATDFIAAHNLEQIQSGEFDALSYAFYKSAFETLSRHQGNESVVRQARHRFTQRVGQLFYDQVHEKLDLSLPERLATASDLSQLQMAIAEIGQFLQIQGYLRDHFAFHFDVDVHHAGKKILQHSDDVASLFSQKEPVYALYEMGYPVILPSAVYLYQTMGEAQHHSSRTIEELFGRIGSVASETSDFDPTGYPSDMVVELWEIRNV